MWELYGVSFQNRLLLGTSLYPSPDMMRQAIQSSGTQIVTASVRRQNPNEHGGQSFWRYLSELGVRILPNTAGCRTAREAVTTAKMTREIFKTNWVKLEVIGDDYNLQPDPFELLIAAKELIKEGFAVFPYTTADLILAQRLVEAGCKVVMPWAAPIGTGKGPADVQALKTLRSRLPETTLIIDAGLGAPSHAAAVMEMGYDGVLLNSAVALSGHPNIMAAAFKMAVEAGRCGFEAELMQPRETACPSTPTIGTPFWHLSKV